MKIKKQTFNKWWKAIKAKPQEQQSEIFDKWLHYCCKTIAMRGDQHQQRIVYTIRNRFKNSRYKKMTKSNAHLIHKLVNNKMYDYRRKAAEINELKRQVEELQGKLKDTINNNVTIKRIKHKKIIHGANRHDS